MISFLKVRKYALFMICTAIIFFACMANSQAQENGTYSSIFKPSESFRSQYVEHKYIPSLSNPIRSKGDFIYLKGEGIGWFMDAPYSMQTIIHSGGLEQWIEGEKQEQPQAVKKAMEQMLVSISALFSGDFGRLETQFSIEEKSTPDKNNLIILTPKTEPLTTYLENISLSGKDYIETIEIHFGPEKYTIVQYEKPLTGAAHITEQEREFFAQ